MAEVGLGLILWEGAFEGVDSKWLRFLDADGHLLPTAEEGKAASEQALKASEEARSLADEAREAAERKAKKEASDTALEIARKMRAEGLDLQMILKLTGIELAE